MGRVRITLSMSLDGYIAGSGVTPETPLGHGGDVIRPGGEPSMGQRVVAESGAAIAGRGVYDLVDGWGASPPYEVPVFVPTHRPRPDRVAGTATFTFVPDVKVALDLAREAAGDKDVYVIGGANVADQLLRLGAIDLIELHLEPVLLGGGVRLFDALGTRIDLERVAVEAGAHSTHLRYDVRKGQTV
ncbi:dihydrofolate reductase family protein [Tenggerimyces flavus]|uniref:Dihydrofolate reductase family protein n=1 Tax=Tenggerimyces flavus TaxID=1708749 RepID=A0ABV7YLR6_9ACTN|nr:dihydrofolate reductase family protein [Tenggerimyces flavus]MBM7787640.1 dihydrofolate reductase [Tenggerimyces flavus]